MKKYILVLLLVLCFCVGCDKIKEFIGGKERTAEELLDKYVDAFMTADPEKARDILPSFVINYKPEKYTKEKYAENLKREKGHFGDDMVASYVLKEKKHLSKEELSELNDEIHKYFNTSDNASDCYMLDGTITLKGSLGEDPDPIGMYYCKYDGTWYLVAG